jgi:hypothetical protein
MPVVKLNDDELLAVWLDIFVRPPVPVALDEKE